ncbi:hypothetical protein D3C72_2367340 [compost metagenome]
MSLYFSASLVKTGKWLLEQGQRADMKTTTRAFLSAKCVAKELGEPLKRSFPVISEGISAFAVAIKKLKRNISIGGIYNRKFCS